MGGNLTTGPIWVGGVHFPQQPENWFDLAGDEGGVGGRRGGVGQGGGVGASNLKNLTIWLGGGQRGGNGVGGRRGGWAREAGSSLP